MADSSRHETLQPRDSSPQRNSHWARPFGIPCLIFQCGGRRIVPEFIALIFVACLTLRQKRYMRPKRMSTQRRVSLIEQSRRNRNALTRNEARVRRSSCCSELFPNRFTSHAKAIASGEVRNSTTVGGRDPGPAAIIEGLCYSQAASEAGRSAAHFLQATEVRTRSARHLHRSFELPAWPYPQSDRQSQLLLGYFP